MTDDPTFDDSRMSIGQHLEELRWHVLKAVGYVAIAFLIAFYAQGPLLEVAQWPYKRAAKNVIDTREFQGVDTALKDSLVEISDGYRELDQALNKAAKDELFLIDSLEPGQLGKALDAIKAEQTELKGKIQALQEEQAALREQDEPVTVAQIHELRVRREALKLEQEALDEKLKQQVGPFKDRLANLPRMDLVQIRPQEAFLSALKLSLVVALFCASPLVARELWSFVSKGLYHHEKKYVRWFAPLTVVAFACGTLFGYFILIPYGIEFLIGYLPDVSGSISFGEYLKLFTLLTVLVGAIFELPLIMVFMTLIGVGNAGLYRRYAKFWFLAAFVIGAVLTPPDPVTQILMAVPLVGLFWVGVLASAIVGKRAKDPEREAHDAAVAAKAAPAQVAETPPPPSAPAAPAIPVLAPPEGTQARGEAESEADSDASGRQAVGAELASARPEATEAESEADSDASGQQAVGAELASARPEVTEAESEAAAPKPSKVITSPKAHYSLSPAELAAYEERKRREALSAPAEEEEDEEEELGEGGEVDDPPAAEGEASAPADGPAAPSDEAPEPKDGDGA